MAAEDGRFQGVVSHIGLERDEAEFHSFNLTLGITVKHEGKLSYAEGERMVKRLQKELLGKNVELGAVAIPCPVCGKTFNTETGMRQHLRKQHGDEEGGPGRKGEKAKKGRPKEAPAKATPRAKKAKKK